MCKIRPDEFSRVNFTCNATHNNIFLWRKIMFEWNVVCVLLVLKTWLKEGKRKYF